MPVLLETFGTLSQLLVVFWRWLALALFPKASLFTSPAGGVPSGATEGSSMGPATQHPFLLFGDHFLDFFLEHFFLIFGPQNGPKIHLKMVPKSVLF